MESSRPTIPFPQHPTFSDPTPIWGWILLAFILPISLMTLGIPLVIVGGILYVRYRQVKKNNEEKQTQFQSQMKHWLESYEVDAACPIHHLGSYQALPIATNMVMTSRDKNLEFYYLSGDHIHSLPVDNIKIRTDTRQIREHTRGYVDQDVKTGFGTVQMNTITNNDPDTVVLQIPLGNDYAIAEIIPLVWEPRAVVHWINQVKQRN